MSLQSRCCSSIKVSLAFESVSVRRWVEWGEGCESLRQQEGFSSKIFPN